MAVRYLSREDTRAFYDRFGKKQDWQRFYEGPALRDILTHGRFEAAQSVFELGYGTGAFAVKLLEDYLPETASYVGVDISPAMAGIARKRLAAFKGRAEVVITDGSLAFRYADGAFDRFVSNYVLDLLSPDDIRQALDEAYRLLRPGGLLCLASLTDGRTLVPRLVTWAWYRVYLHKPGSVGGCRPIRLLEYVGKGSWLVEHHRTLNAFGIPTEILTASKLI